jgi:hypothetical protein
MIKNSSINAAWHKEHRMPKNASLDQRINWHVEHLQNCRCRQSLPARLKEEMERRNIPVPALQEDLSETDDKHFAL